MSDLAAPFLLQMGDCVIEDGTGTGPYHVKGLSFPEPDDDGYGNKLPAVRTISPLEVTGTSVADLNANIARLRREGVRDKLLRWRSPGGTEVLESRIRSASIVEEVCDPIERGLALKTTLKVVVFTEPGWWGDWTAETTVDQATVPGHFVITNVPGEGDARMRIRALYADQGTAAAIAVQPDPGPGYDYLDDYGTAGDTADANALGGYKVGETVDATLDGNEIGTAPTIDTNDNRGPQHLFVRADTDAATPANTTVRAVTTTTGNLIADSVSVPEQAVAASTGDLIGYELGDIQIPAGQVPDVATGSGWTAEAVKASQTTDDGTLVLSSAVSGMSYQKIEAKQTFAAFDGRITAIEYTIDTPPAEWVSANLVLFDGINIVRTVTAPLTAGTHKVELPTPYDVVASGAYAFSLALNDNLEGSFTVGFAYGNNRLATYALTTPTGSGEAATDDLVFKVYGQERLGFNTSVAIQAACSESSKKLYLDYVQRIPLGYAVIIYRRSTAGTLALFYDGDTDTPYIADADGIGPALFDKVEIRRPLRCRPGVDNWVVLGALQADEAIGGGTFVYSLRPCYYSATGA